MQWTNKAGHRANHVVRAGLVASIAALMAVREAMRDEFDLVQVETEPVVESVPELVSGWDIESVSIDMDLMEVMESDINRNDDVPHHVYRTRQEGWAQIY